MKGTTKKEQRIQRHKRVRSKIKGTADVPRLAVFKSNTTVYAQLIDDLKGSTIGSSDTKRDKNVSGVGKAIAKIAKSKNIDKVVFDRGGFRYTGKIKELADAAREAGLTF